MADLLECLVQINALKETSGRIAALVRHTEPEEWARRPAEGVWAPVEVLAHLADTELVFGVQLRLMLSSHQPPLPRLDQAALAERARYREWPPELGLQRFSARRAETLELLEDCSADELARVGIHPIRGEMTVADLVALMLAHDTAHVGHIRQRLRTSLATPGGGGVPP